MSTQNLETLVGRRVASDSKSPESTTTTHDDLAKAARQAGFEDSEVVLPGDITTCEYRDKRVRFHLNSQGIIERVSQG